MKTLLACAAAIGIAASPATAQTPPQPDMHHHDMCSPDRHDCPDADGDHHMMHHHMMMHRHMSMHDRMMMHRHMMMHHRMMRHHHHRFHHHHEQNEQH